MSHRSGITLTEDLAIRFSQLRDQENDKPSVRAIKICIENESLLEKAVCDVKGDWQEDYDVTITSFVNDTDPCYILYRTDSKNSIGCYLWIYVVYIPDMSKVRQKMLYASTRATLKKEFGSDFFSDELFGTELSDVNLSGYNKHVASAKASPLSFYEQEMEDCTTTNNVIQALKDFKTGVHQYVQLEIDIPEEMIRLVVADNTNTISMADNLNMDHPRYHFIAYNHEHDGQKCRPMFFVYSCPANSCSVKERMMYASCKSHVVAEANAIGLEFIKMLEVDEPNDVTHKVLHELVYPPPVEVKKVYLRVRAPGRGAPRLIRNSSSESVRSAFSGN